MNARPSTIVLLIVNMIPLAGVLFFDWRVVDVMMLYWAENVVIGLVNVLRIAVSSGSVGDSRTGARIRAAIEAAPQARGVSHQLIVTMMKIIMVPVFIVHYSLFCMGHLFALNILFYEGDSRIPSIFSIIGFDPAPIMIGIVAVAFSHLYSFFANFIGQGEYKRTGPIQMMGRPYGRLVALHLAILAGAYLVQTLGAQLFMLVILVLAKTVADAKLHTIERNKFAMSADSSVPDTEEEIRRLRFR